MISDSVFVISVFVVVIVKGGGGVRNYVYVLINKKKMFVFSFYMWV